MVDILSFSGMYDEYDPGFIIRSNVIDLRGVSGTKLYVDSAAETAIREEIRIKGRSDIHLIDTGDYHYVTRLYLYDILEPFDLLVFDHHNDDKPPEFEGLRSCGSWIRDALYDMDNTISSVKLVKGVQDITYLKGSFDEKKPLYISIDKDVLSKDACPTNWDQGEMTVPELLSLLKGEIRNRRILGMDICGGPAFEAGFRNKDIVKNNEVDMAIIALL